MAVAVERASQGHGFSQREFGQSPELLLRIGGAYALVELALIGQETLPQAHERRQLFKRWRNGDTTARHRLLVPQDAQREGMGLEQVSAIRSENPVLVGGFALLAPDQRVALDRMGLTAAIKIDQIIDWHGDHYWTGWEIVQPIQMVLADRDGVACDFPGSLGQPQVSREFEGVTIERVNNSPFLGVSLP